MKVGFIGVGKLGKDAAEVMAEKHDVIGYDVQEVQPENFKMVGTLEEVCKDSQLIFIAVPTPHHRDYDGRYPTSHLPNKDFDYSIVKGILEEINKYTTKDQLVVLISTVLPGTTRKEFMPLVENYRFIYNPYLIAQGTVKWDMINPEMVIIGTEDGTTTGDVKILLEFYETFITEGTRYEIGTWDEAESIKIFYNTFLSMKVAFANMVQDVAEGVGNINADVVMNALRKSNQRIISPTYLKPGMGDGGGCHPRDNIALRTLAEKLDLGYDIFSVIMKAREVQAENIANVLVHESKQNYNAPIVILGASYKPGVDYLDGSTSIMVGHYCNTKGHPPLFDLDERFWEGIPFQKTIFLLGHLGSHHNYPFPNNSIVVDPWREFKTDNDTIKVIQYGNTRK
jgi:UDPglucose 6-dehydrogenase